MAREAMRLSTSKWRCWAVATVLLAACASSPTAPSEPRAPAPQRPATNGGQVAGDPVADQAIALSEPLALRFAWGEGFSARVEVTATRHKRNPRRTVTREFAATHELSATPTDEGFLLRTHGFELRDAAISGLSSQAARQVGGLMARMALLRAPRRISREGKFLGLHEADAFSRGMTTWLRESVGEVPQGPVAHMMSALEQSLQPEALQAQARFEWRSRLGLWCGRTLGPGESIALQERWEEIPAAMNPGPVSYRLEADGWVRCQRDASDRRCVRLRATGRFGGAQLVRSIEQTLGIPAPEGLAVKVVLTTTLVVVPATLVPHRIREEKRTRGWIRRPNAQDEQVVDDWRQTDWTYHYEPRGAAPAG